MTEAATDQLKQSSKDYFLSIIGSYIVMGLSLLLAVLLTRLLGAAGYGRLAFLLAIGQTAAYLTTFWTTAGLVRFGTELWISDDGFHRVFWARNAAMLVPILLLGGLAALFFDPLIQWLKLSSGDLTAALAYMFGTVLFQTSQFTFQALKCLRLFTLWQVIEKTCLVAVVVWLGSVHFSHGILPFVVLYAITSAGVGLLSLLLLDHHHWWPIRSDRSTFKRFIQFSWPLLLSLACGYLSMNWVDLLVIRYYASFADVGQYNLAYQIMGVIQVLPTLSFPVILPLLVGWKVNNQEGGLRLYTGRLIPHACVAMSGLLIVLLSLLKPMLVLVFGQEFAASVVPCGWLMVAVSCYGVFISGMPLLNLWEQTKTIFMVSAAAGIVNVLGDLLLVPRFGITGAALATFCAYATSASLVTHAVRLRLALARKPLFLSVVAVTTACLGCVTFSGIVPFVVGLGSAVLLLGLAVGMGQLFRSQDRQWLRVFFSCGL